MALALYAALSRSGIIKIMFILEVEIIAFNRQESRALARRAISSSRNRSSFDQLQLGGGSKSFWHQLIVNKNMSLSALSIGARKSAYQRNHRIIGLAISSVYHRHVVIILQAAHQNRGDRQSVKINQYLEIVFANVYAADCNRPFVTLIEKHRLVPEPALLEICTHASRRSNGSIDEHFSCLWARL